MTAALIFNGIQFYCRLLLIATGFAVVLSGAGFFNFGHAVLITFGAYCFFVLTEGLSVPVIAALVLSGALSAVLGASLQLAVYSPLARHRCSNQGLLLASLGVYIIGENLLSIIFGDDRKIAHGFMQTSGFRIAGMDVTVGGIATVSCCAAVVVTTLLFLHSTRVGTLLRAVSNDRVLALRCGVDTNSVLQAAVVIGSGIAGLGGAMLALEVPIVPTLGLEPLMLAVVAVVLGGGSISGIAVAGFALTITEQLAVSRLNTQWQDAIAFAILLVALQLKPLHVLGRTEDRFARGEW